MSYMAGLCPTCSNWSPAFQMLGSVQLSIKPDLEIGLTCHNCGAHFRMHASELREIDGEPPAKFPH